MFTGTDMLSPAMCPSRQLAPWTAGTPARPANCYAARRRRESAAAGGSPRRLGISSPGAPSRAAGLDPVSRWGSAPASTRTSRQLGLLACPAIYLVISARASRGSDTSWQQQLSQTTHQVTTQHIYSQIGLKCSKLLTTHK